MKFAVLNDADFGLFIAVADPTNLQVLDEIRFATSKQTEAILVEADKLAATIDRALLRLDWFLEFDEDRWTTRFDNCEGRINASRAFDNGFNPLGYYRDAQGVWIDYDYENFFDFPRNYEYYSSHCWYYLSEDWYRGAYPMSYEALFSCVNWVWVCDVYVSTKRHHAQNVRELLQEEVFPSRRDIHDSLWNDYWTLMNDTFVGSFGSDLSSIDGHRDCMQAFDEYLQLDDFPIDGKIQNTQ